MGTSDVLPSATGSGGDVTCQILLIDWATNPSSTELTILIVLIFRIRLRGVGFDGLKK